VEEGIEVKRQGGRMSRRGLCTEAQPEAARGGGSNAGPALSFAEVAGSNHRIRRSFGSLNLEDQNLKSPTGKFRLSIYTWRRHQITDWWIWLWVDAN
jgi:hypothetical protein